MKTGITPLKKQYLVAGILLLCYFLFSIISHSFVTELSTTFSEEPVITYYDFSNGEIATDQIYQISPDELEFLINEDNSIILEFDDSIQNSSFIQDDAVITDTDTQAVDNFSSFTSNTFSETVFDEHFFLCNSIYSSYLLLFTAYCLFLWHRKCGQYVYLISCIFMLLSTLLTPLSNLLYFQFVYPDSYMFGLSIFDYYHTAAILSILFSLPIPVILAVSHYKRGKIIKTAGTICILLRIVSDLLIPLFFYGHTNLLILLINELLFLACIVPMWYSEMKISLTFKRSDTNHPESIRKELILLKQQYENNQLTLEEYEAATEKWLEKL